MENKDVNKDVNESYKIPDVLWAEIEPLRRPEKPKPKVGCPRMSNRKAMDARFLHPRHWLSAESTSTWLGCAKHSS